MTEKYPQKQNEGGTSLMGPVAVIALMLVGVFIAYKVFMMLVPLVLIALVIYIIYWWKTSS